MNQHILSSDPADRIARALRSLDGLSVGDGFGDQFFALRSGGDLRLAERIVPPPPWLLTDDSIMAISIVRVLLERGEVDQDRLAAHFAAEFARDPGRGYGGMAREILSEIGRGGDWRLVAAAAFDGQGSCGNGSAMRVAPLGAYFADDLPRVRDEAARSAAVTHAHPEALAGAIAVAVAAAGVARGEATDFASLLVEVCSFTPAGEVREALEWARDLGPEQDVRRVARKLGNGARVTSQDTVPFCIWSAARNLADFERAMWETVSVGGDLDTNCAIVGGIIAAGSACVPADWLADREPLTPFLRFTPETSAP